MKARQIIEVEDPKHFLKNVAEPKVISECGNCGWKGEPTIEFPNIPDLMQRIEPGGTVPSGECPQCGALCYEIKKLRRLRRQPGLHPAPEDPRGGHGHYATEP